MVFRWLEGWKGHPDLDLQAKAPVEVYPLKSCAVEILGIKKNTSQ